MQEEREEKVGKDGEKQFLGECANYIQEMRGARGVGGGNGNGAVLKVRTFGVFLYPRLNQRKDSHALFFT